MGTIGPHSHQQRAVKKDYPVVEGLTADSTKQTGKRFLVSEIEGKSLIRCQDRVGF